MAQQLGGNGMKVYDYQNKLQEVICNKCGKKLRVEKGMLLEGILEVKQNFGYFSNKDGLTHEFDLCEDCYDKMIAGFVVPVSEEEQFAWQAE